MPNFQVKPLSFSLSSSVFEVSFFFFFSVAAFSYKVGLSVELSGFLNRGFLRDIVLNAEPFRDNNYGFVCKFFFFFVWHGTIELSQSCSVFLLLLLVTVLFLFFMILRSL